MGLGRWVRRLAGLRVRRFAGSFFRVSAVVCLGVVCYPFGVGWGALVLSVRAGLAVVFPFGGLVVVCSFVLVGSVRLSVFVPASLSGRSFRRFSVWGARCPRAVVSSLLRALRLGRRSARLSAWLLAPVPAPFPPAPAPAPVAPAPAPLSFPPAVWSLPSPGFRAAVVALSWRSRCPAGGARACSCCPCAVVSWSLVAASVFPCPSGVALSSFPSVPLSLCVCALSGRRCVSLRSLLPPGVSV